MHRTSSGDIEHARTRPFEGLTVRQIERLDSELAQRALTIIRDPYADFGPTLACEKLYECHDIRLAKETVRNLMTEAGLWLPRRQRPHMRRATARHHPRSIRPFTRQSPAAPD